MAMATSRGVLTERVDDEDRELIAARVLMGERGVSQRDLAARTGWSQPTINRILAGQRQTTTVERRLLHLAITDPDLLALLRGQKAEPRATLHPDSFVGQHNDEVAVVGESTG